MKFVIGLFVISASMVGGYIGFGGKLSVLWQPWEVVIIVGAAVGAFILSNSSHVILDTGKALTKVVRGSSLKQEDYLELLSLLFAIFRESKAKGVMALENDIERPYESSLFKAHPRALQRKRAIGFLCDYLRLISLGSENSHELEVLMDQEIDTLRQEMSRPVKALNTVGEALPAFGIIAAILGIIKAMGYVNQSTEVLGGMIGGALVGTFLGVLLAYALVMPVASLIASQRDETINYYNCMKAGLIAYLNGYPPQIAIEYARKVLFVEVQPTFDSVEKTTTETVRALAQAA